MNITDLIIEQLQQGNLVELPGMGTFGSEMQPPYHEASTGVFYPSRRTLTFSTATSGNDSDIVRVLAQRECVGENVARQMWKNYVDALTDKLQRTGSHAFGELGTLKFDGQGYAFQATPGAVLSTGDEKPLEGVKTYAHNTNDDPFAQFDDNAAEKQAQAEAAARAEAERREAEQKAEEARREAERKAEEERRAAEARAEQERQEAEEERLKAEKEAAEKEAAEERAAVEAAAALAALKPDEAEASEKEEKKVKKEKKEKKHKEKKEKKCKKDKKKRKFPWWILLLLLLLLLLGGAAYYYFYIYRPAQPTAEYTPSQPASDVDIITDLTYNTDMLEYGQRDIDVNSDRVCATMTDYVYSFLAYRHYASAMEPMMERVRQYAQERLGELMSDRFAVQRLYPFCDYVYSYNEPQLRQVFAQHQRCTVQGELLDMHLLDGMLEKMVAELGLEPDAGAPRGEAAPAVAVAPVAKPAPAPQADNIPVNVEQNSKQGFDIIAGFYLDRATAARLTARLHELGSDAYIIEKNNMYYVSMGSAKNRTSAEALFKHIKSWYDGDIAIKQW